MAFSVAGVIWHGTCKEVAHRPDKGEQLMARLIHISNINLDHSQVLVSLPEEEKILRKLMRLLNEDFTPRAALNARHLARGDA